MVVHLQSVEIFYHNNFMWKKKCNIFAVTNAKQNKNKNKKNGLATEEEVQPGAAFLSEYECAGLKDDIDDS